MLGNSKLFGIARISESAVSRLATRKAPSLAGSAGEAWKWKALVPLPAMELEVRQAAPTDGSPGTAGGLGSRRHGRSTRPRASIKVPHRSNQRSEAQRSGRSESHRCVSGLKPGSLWRFFVSRLVALSAVDCWMCCREFLCCGGDGAGLGNSAGSLLAAERNFSEPRVAAIVPTTKLAWPLPSRDLKE